MEIVDFTLKVNVEYKLLVDKFKQNISVRVFYIFIELKEIMSSVGLYYKSKKSFIASEGFFIPKKIILFLKILNYF